MEGRVVKGQGVELQISGVAQTVLAMQVFANDTVYKVLDREVRAILKRTKASAASRFSRGSWTISVGKNVKAPLGMIATAAGSSRGFKRWIDAPGGVQASIWDNYGRNTSVDSMRPQAAAFGRHLNEKYGKPQRILWPAWMENRTESEREIEAAFDRAERQLQTEIDKAG